MRFLKAAALNSQGIHFMSIGKHEAALLLFDKALTISRSLSCDEAISSDSTAGSCKLQAIPFASDASKHTLCPSFDQCFAVVLDPFVEKPSTKNEVELLIATTLYNVALACHHEALSRGTQRSSYLETTLRIYHMAVNVLLNLEGSADCLSLLLATSNNLANLALENFDYDSFDRYRGWVGYFLISQKNFHPDFFSGNFAATCSVRESPAAAA